MHEMNQSKDSEKAVLRAITVRIKTEEYELLREYAEAQQLSLNAVVSEALAQFGARIRRRQWMAEVKDLQRRIHDECGVGADSVALIREAREERDDQLHTACSPTERKPEGGPES